MVLTSLEPGVSDVYILSTDHNPASEKLECLGCTRVVPTRNGGKRDYIANTFKDMWYHILHHMYWGDKVPSGVLARLNKNMFQATMRRRLPVVAFLFPNR